MVGILLSKILLLYSLSFCNWLEWKRRKGEKRKKERPCPQIIEKPQRSEGPLVSVAILCNGIPLTSVFPRLEIATLNRADSDLEACRTQISKDIIALLLKNLTSSGQLSPQVERRMGAVFKKQFLLLEKEIQEEYDRKMVALTAECDLETRKKTESQYQREMAALEEAEEVLKRVSERVRQL